MYYLRFRLRSKLESCGTLLHTHVPEQDFLYVLSVQSMNFLYMLESPSGRVSSRAESTEGEHSNSKSDNAGFRNWRCAPRPSLPEGAEVCAGHSVKVV